MWIRRLRPCRHASDFTGSRQAGRTQRVAAGGARPARTGGDRLPTCRQPVGLSPLVKAFCGLWIGSVGCGFLGFVAVVVARAVRGEVTGGDFLACLVPLSMMAFFVALTAWGKLIDRGEATYLGSWLADRLQTAEAGIRGYRPWQGNPPR